MTGLLLTQSTTPIIGQVAWLLGKIMNVIFNILSNVFGIESIGLCIIIFTIVVYTFMIPLTIRQQKFSKMSAVMNPELQAIQKKYKNKKDQASMTKQQEETQLVYEKYGSSPMGGCSQLLVQMPIFLGLYAVIRNIPAYVDTVKDAYMPLVEGIMSTDGYQKLIETIGAASPVSMAADKFDYTQVNTIIDVLYKFQSGTWATLTESFPGLSNLIATTQSNVEHFNSFLGINIAETPMTLFMDSIKTGAIISVIVAVAIPVMSGLSQYLSIRLTSANQSAATGDQDNAMANSMNTMNKAMPLLSVFMCFSFPSGIGLYWTVSALVRCVQQVVINKYLSKQPVEELIKKNQEKAAKKREKKGTSASKLSEMAQKSVRNIEEPKKSNLSDKEKENKLNEAAKKNEQAKSGSLAARARLTKRYNENE